MYVCRGAHALRRSFYFILVNDGLPVHVHAFSFFIVSSISSFEILFTAYISEIIHWVLPALQVFAIYFIIFSIV
jgi:hypothetical protein